MAAGATVLLTAACSTLLAPEATPVPGAAATLTRSINTPIPTPIRTPSTVPSASPSVARIAVAVSPGPSPAADDQSQALSDADLAAVQRSFQQFAATAALNGIDALLLDHVALSTPQGGSVMTDAEAASWLRDHAGAGITVSSVTRGAQEPVIHVLTEGWPQMDPIQSGQVSFSLRRYDANGRQDESGGGTWKVDVIEAD